MAFVACRGCGRHISETLDRCPHCGRSVIPTAATPTERQRIVERLRRDPTRLGDGDDRMPLPDHTPIPSWVIWSVPLAVLLVIAVTILRADPDRRTRIATDDLTTAVLQPWEAPGSTLHRRSYWDVDTDFARLGATDAFQSVFTDLPPGDIENREPIAVWREGATYVWSVAMQTGDESEALDVLESIWDTYALGATERQRGPDGSLLIFNPDFQETAGGPVAPMGVASWRVGATVLHVIRLGAGSASDVLQIARRVQDHIDEARQGGAPQRPFVPLTEDEQADAERIVVALEDLAGSYPTTAEWFLRADELNHPGFPDDVERCLAVRRDDDEPVEVGFRPDSITPAPGWEFPDGERAGSVPEGTLYSIEILFTDPDGTDVVSAHVAVIGTDVHLLRNCGTR